MVMREAAFEIALAPTLQRIIGWGHFKYSVCTPRLWSGIACTQAEKWCLDQEGSKKDHSWLPFCLPPGVAIEHAR